MRRSVGGLCTGKAAVRNEWLTLYACAHVYDVGPGMGVYIPQTSAHMMETSDEPSITISLTYSTNQTRRNAMQHVMHDLLYRAGMRPPSVGTIRLFDNLAYAGASALVAAHGPGSHTPTCPSLAHHTPYAIADLKRQLLGSSFTRPP